VGKERAEGFPWRHRIVRRVEYHALYESGRKLHSESFVLFGRVVRNRIKRLFREVFRRSRLEIPNHFDFVVNAKRDCRNVDLESLRKEFLAAALRFSR
jgi:RNase P protein component